MAVYTNKMKSAIRNLKNPHDLTVDIVEYDFHPPYIGIRFYESEWRYLSESERLRSIGYLNKIKSIVEAHGVNATLDPVYDVPGGQQLA